jgi:hypothetical protein
MIQETRSIFPVPVLTSRHPLLQSLNRYEEGIEAVHDRT